MADENARDGVTKAEEIALAHAWNWFAVHAGQRLQVFNFFSVATAFLLAGFISAHNDAAYRLAAGVAAAGALLSLAFNLVERRTRELVKTGERALDVLEQRLAESIGDESILLVHAVERPDHRWTKYSFVFNTIQRAAIAAWLLAAVLEFVR